MNPAYYHFLHVVGAVVMFAGFGSLLTSDERARRIGGMLHGVGLLILLIAAFGFIAKSRPALVISYGSVFVIVKAVIWLLLGFLPVLAKRKVMSPGAVLILAVVLGACAAYIGYFKPLALQ